MIPAQLLTNPLCEPGYYRWVSFKKYIFELNNRLHCHREMWRWQTIKSANFFFLYFVTQIVFRDFQSKFSFWRDNKYRWGRQSTHTNKVFIRVYGRLILALLPSSNEANIKGIERLLFLDISIKASDDGTQVKCQWWSLAPSHDWDRGSLL